MENETVVRKKSVFGLLSRLIVSISLIITIIIILIIIAGFYFATGGAESFVEDTIAEGSHLEKIAILNIDGIIAEESFTSFKKQIKMAQEDDAVKAIIVRVNSPGGSVSDSDNIYHLINQYRNLTGKTAVCFMDGLAASGGYYSAAACDKIIASPTTITGSIGVIMGHFNINGLLSEKLGITQTTIKSGEKKDWPSPFRELSVDEKQYLFDRVISPAYERFVEIVEKGRPNLTKDQIRTMADGGIFFADDALNKGLVDGIGYIEKAIAETTEMAKLQNPKVVEYKKPFSLSDFMTSQSKTNPINIETFKQMACPEIMYLWTGNN